MATRKPDAIRTVGLTKKFGSFVAVNELDLQVQAGEIFGFLGPNGAGKSTTIRMLLDQLRASSGSATVLGHDIYDESLEIRRRIGYIFGDLSLYQKLTGRRTIEYFAGIRGGVDMDFVEELTERLDADLSRRVSEYSTGNRQKIGLIQAFMHKPDLLMNHIHSSSCGQSHPGQRSGVLRSCRSRRGRCALAATPLGWMHAEFLSILGPGFLIATAMMSAASATAGEEQARTLGLVLSAGVTRTTFLSAKAAAMITHVLIVAAAIFAGMVIAGPIGGLGIPVLASLAATVNMILVALVYGAIALTLGAITADKRLTLSITGALLGVSFIAASFLGLKESLVWLSKINFWYPYLANPALAEGINWGYAAIMAGLAVGIGALAFIAFPRRRDLRG